MAMKQACVITVTSVKGGTGKTVNVLNMAGLYCGMDKKVLVIDLDLYTGGIACALNIDNDKDLFLLVNDMNNNKFDFLENYLIKYNENIDVLVAPRDPRDASKISAKYLNVIIAKAKLKYDVVLIDTNHTLDECNLLAFDNSDYILYMLSNNTLDIKNIKTMISIFKDMDMDNYRIILNNALIKNKDYFNEYDIKNIIKGKIDYVISDNFFERHIDKYILNGEIMTLNKVFIKKHKKDIDGFKSFLNVLLKEKV